MRRLLGLLFVVTSAALAWLLWSHAAGAQPPEAAGAARSAAAATRTAAVPGAGIAVRESVPITGEAAPAAQAATTGALVVRATFAGDAVPVPNLAILIAPDLDWSRPPTDHLVRTDPGGTARFDELAPGQYVVAANRFAWTAGDVRAGAETLVELEIPRHGTLAGRVVDDSGAAIAGAEVVGVPDYLDAAATVLARTGRDGRFECALRNVNTQVFARKAGHGTSGALEHVSFCGERIEIELVLSRHARPLRGLIVDERGAPVGGAELVLSPFAPAARDATMSPVARCARARSEVDGRFVVEDVPPGRFGGVARAPGFATVFFDGEQSEARDGQLTVTLAPGATLRGRVVDATGAPVAGALVEAPIAEPWDRVSVTTDASGRYELDGLDPSAVLGSKPSRVTALHPTAGFAHADFEIEFGATIAWNPTLEIGRSIEGQVIRADGSPLAGVPVQAEAGRASTPPALTDRDGRFVVRRVENVPHDVVVHSGGGLQRAELARVADVRPGGFPLEIVVADERWPTAYVTGTLIRPPGYAQEPVRMQWWSNGLGWGSVVGVAPGGEFRVGPLAPGTYQAAVIGYRSKLSGLDLGPYQVAPHQELDLGRVAITAPIVVELAPRMPTGHVIGPIVGRLLRASDRKQCAIAVHEMGATRTVGALEPGAYVLSIESGLGFAALELGCELRAGPPNVVAFDLAPLRWVRLRAVTADGAGATPPITFRITPPTPMGAEFHPPVPLLNVSLPTGRYEVNARAGELRGTRALDVDAPAGAVIELDVILR